MIDLPPLMIDCTISPFSAEASSALVVLEMTPTEPSFRMVGDAPFEAVSAMAAGLAHEIKNPLGGLRGAAQLLERELPRAELREYTQVIIREADRLGRLVERMTGVTATLDARTIQHSSSVGTRATTGCGRSAHRCGDLLRLRPQYSRVEW